MSHHPEGRPTGEPLLRLLQGSAARRPSKLWAPVFYCACLTAPVGVRLLVAAVMEAMLRGRAFAPSQARLGRTWHRDRRTISRWVRLAVAHHWLRRRRRGRTRTNTYQLTPYFWRRVTGRYQHRVPTEVQETLWRLGLRIGVDPGTMRRHGVGGGSSQCPGGVR